MINQPIESSRTAEIAAQMVLPNLLFLGGDKCGSTWLYEFLRSSEEVAVCSPKELFFFTSQFQRGVPWYSSFFENAVDLKWRAEVCHDYLYSEVARERVSRLMSKDELRLLAAVRNPIDRALSSYRFKLKHGIVGGGFWEACSAEPDILRNGFYSADLQRWANDGWPLYVFVVEDLRSRGDTLVDELSSWLNIARPGLSPDELVNEAAVARSPLVSNYARRAGQAARSLGLMRLVAEGKSNNLLRHLLYAPASAQLGPALTEGDVCRLKQYYEDEVIELGNFLQRDLLGEWFG